MPLRAKLLLFLCVFAIFLTGAAPVRSGAETFRNPQRIPLPVDPYALTTGDLDGDGHNDIVWVEYTQSSVTSVLHVLLAGPNDRYTAAPNVSVPATYIVSACIVEDVTGDKKNDLICAGVSNYNNVALFIYRGNGDGTFAPPVQTAVTAQPAYVYPILARAGDLNGDGLPDIILMSADYSGVLPLLSDGKGSFQVGPVIMGSFNYSVPTITDLNGDGILDVLWPTGPRVDFGKGGANFSPIAQYDPGYLSNCAFADVDRDGHLDAVCTWYDAGSAGALIKLTVLHGNADGSFSTTPLFTRTFGSGASSADAMATITTPILVTDLNGDGYPDIVALSGDGYCVLLGGPNATWNGSPQQFVSALSPQSYLTGINGTSIADMNGDGLPDIVTVGPNGLYITYAQRDGTLSSAPAPVVGQISTSATLADFDGDGNLDVVSAGDTALKLSKGRGDGTFTAPQPVTVTGNFQYETYVLPLVLSGDFNGDGKQDLLAYGNTSVTAGQTYLILGQGDGTFATPSPVNLSITAARATDLNGDGRSDVYAIANNSTGTNLLKVSLFRADGTFTTVSTNLPAEPLNSSTFYTAPSFGPAFADFRHVGRLDAAVASDNNAYLLRSHGDGTFDSTGTTLPIPDLPGFTKVSTYDVASGDFDADGNADIAVLVQYGSGFYSLGTPTSAVWIYYGNGDGTFSAAVLAGTFNRDAQTLSAGDLNGDGLPDLVLTSESGYQDNGVLLVHALAGRAWGPEFDYAAGQNYTRPWITDLNHDGRNDLVFSNAEPLAAQTSSIAVLLNQAADTATGTLTASPEPSNITYPFTLTAALSTSSTTDVLSGNVTFSLDGTVVGTGALTGNTATLALSGQGIAAGLHTLTATWPGNASLPALTLSGTHTVTLLPLNLGLAATPTTLSVGSAVTATATLIPATPPTQPGYQFTGTLTLSDNGVVIASQQASTTGPAFTLPSLTAGIHTLSVAYSGDALFAPAKSTAVVVTVAGAPSVITLAATPSTAPYGTPVTLAAGVSAVTPGSLPVPTGTVTFTVDGAPQPPVALTQAVATSILGTLVTGTHTVSCTYAGDSTFAPSTCNTVTVTIQPGTSALTITSSQNPSLAYAPVTFTIHLALNGKPAPAGTQFTFSLYANSGNFVLATDSSGNATYTTSQLFARTWLTEAIFAAGNYANAIAQYTQIVTAAPTTLTLSATPNPAYLGQAVTFTAHTTGSGTNFPTGAVTFLENGTVLGTGTLNASGQASFSTAALPIGTHVVTAAFAGDVGFSPAASPAVNLVVLSSGFTVALSPPSIKVTQGAIGTTAVQLGSLGNFAGPLALTYGKLPTNATATLSAGNATLTAGSKQSVTFSFDTVQVAATLVASRPASLVLSASIFLLLPLSFKRRRTLTRLLGLALLLVSLQVITACSTTGVALTPVAAGTYQVPIIATDVHGNTQSSTLTVIVVAR